MAKRTRYPNRTTGRAKPRRETRPSSAGSSPAASAAIPDRARTSTRPVELDEILDSTPDADDDADVDLPARSSSGLTEAEMERAAALEAEMNAREKAAIAESLRRRARPEERERLAGDVNAPLSVRAAHEYAYVARDVRRIGVTAGAMIAILAVLYLLTHVLGVIPI